MRACTFSTVVLMAWASLSDVAAPVAAQELTIDEVVALGLRQAPELAASRAEAEARRAEIVQAGLRTNPMVSVFRTEQVGGRDHDTMVDVEWPLDLFRRPARVAVARAGAAVAHERAEDHRRTLAAGIRAQAGRVLAAGRAIDVLEEVIQTAGTMQALLDARVAEGAAPRLDASLAAVELARLQALRVRARAEYGAALVELKARVGLPPDDALVLRDRLEVHVRREPGVLPPVHVGPRADVRASEAGVTRAEARIAELRREARPDASLYGSYSRMAFGFPQRGFDPAGGLAPIEGTFHNVTAGVMVRLPIWNRNQGAIAAARAERDAARHAATAQALQARADVDQATIRDRAARESLEVLAGEARPLARANLDVVREAYALGRATLADVLSAQRSYLDLEQAYTDALAQVFEARTALLAARGDLP